MTGQCRPSVLCSLQYLASAGPLLTLTQADPTAPPGPAPHPHMVEPTLADPCSGQPQSFTWQVVGSKLRLTGQHCQASAASPYLARLTRRDPWLENARKGCTAAGFTAPFRLTVANASARRAPGLVCDHLNEMRPRRDGHSFQTQAGLSSDAGVGNVARIGSIGFAQEQVGRTMGPTRSAYDAGISNGSGVEHHFGPVLLAKGPFILPPP